MRQTFRQEEAEQILREAVRRDVDLQTPGASPVTRDRLQAMADELGIAPEALEAVLRDREQAAVQAQAQASAQMLRREFIAERRAEVLSQLYSFVGIFGVLVAIWFFTSRAGHFWPQWPALGFGIALFLKFLHSLPTGGPEFEREFAEWQEKRGKRQAKRAMRAARSAENAVRAAAEAELDE